MTTITNAPIIENDKTWQQLVQASFISGARGGYKNFMRRSLQQIVLYEALRCCKDSLPTLRPFQRKIALLDMAKALVGTLDFLDAEQQAQVLWRTNSSQELVNENNCWNRRKILLHELEKINEEMKVLMGGGRVTQDEALKEYLQQKYDEVHSGTPAAETDENKKDTPPPNFFFKNHILPCYMLYYLNGDLNPSFPTPNPPKAILVVAKKPAHMMKNKNRSDAEDNNMDEDMANLALKDVGDDDDDEAMADIIPGEEKDDFEGDEEGWDIVAGEEPTVVTTTKKAAVAVGPSLPKIGKAAGAPGGGKSLLPLRRRMLMLQSIKYHMELLKEFEGVVPQEELDERKRELYVRLTNMGTGGGGKKAKKNKAALAKVAGMKKAPVTES